MYWENQDISPMFSSYRELFLPYRGLFIQYLYLYAISMNKRSNYTYPDLHTEPESPSIGDFTFLSFSSLSLYVHTTGMVSKMAGLVIFGLSRTAAPLIVSIFVGSLNTWAIATSRSLISKVHMSQWNMSNRTQKGQRRNWGKYIPYSWSSQYGQKVVPEHYIPV